MRVGDKTIEMAVGDICDQQVDAIVNAANNHMWMGAGVAGAIKRRGGQEIEDEAIAKGPIPVGEAAVTNAGKLAAKYVIHAAAMGQDLTTSADLIRQATLNSMKRAAELGIESIAFPLLGTGVGGFDVKEAGRIMLDAVRDALAEETTVARVVFCIFPPADREFAAAMGEMDAQSNG
jgi:O-acetyl-ADP-ribose deacetylase (regulator of RNase III)